MALYYYKAISPAGEKLEGEMECATTEEVIRRLQEAGNIPIKATLASAGAAINLRNLGFRKRGISSAQITVFTRELATLIGAGLPLDRALQVLADLAEDDKVARLVVDIREKVRGGGALSDALEAQHSTFDKLYVNMVRAGEMGGSLDETLEQLADYLERAKETRDSVTSALIYPTILLIMAGVSVMILMLFVVPQFAAIFEDLEGDLPLATQITIGFGTLLQDYWWLLLAAVGGIIYFMRWQLSDAAKRYRWHQRVLSLPLVGELIRVVETARLTRTVGTLVHNGVPLLSALALGKGVLKNDVLAEGVEIAAAEVKDGGGLAQTLAATERFPNFALQMISLGEETGRLDEMLLEVAKTYDKKVQTTIERMLALLVPLLILGLASIIAFIVISILLALVSVSDFVM